MIAANYLINAALGGLCVIECLPRTPSSAMRILSSAE
jgi:hypothetical protein